MGKLAGIHFLGMLINLSDSFNVSEAGIQTGLGVASLGLAKAAAPLTGSIPGITSGNGSFQHVTNTLLTKLSKGQISNLSPKSILKIATTYLVTEGSADTVIKAGESIAEKVTEEKNEKEN